MRSSRIIAFLLAVGFGFGGSYAYFNTDWSGQRQGEQRRGRRFVPPDEAVPVTVQTVTVRDVPVERDGIGNVQAYASIVMKPQVDGRLMSIEFREGQDVKRGDVLARIDPAIYQAQYDQARAKKAQNEANLANAKIDLERYERLAATNAGSKQQAEGQKAMVAQLEAQVRADQAAIDNAKAYLDYTVVTAPMDGRLGLRLVDVGNIVRTSDANGIVSIAQVKPITVLFTLPQRDLVAVNDAMARGGVKVDALEADGRTSLSGGKLEVVDNQIDTSTGAFKLKAVFPNEDLRLWPGQFVSVRVRVATLVGAKVAPTPAVRRGPNGPFVYVLSEDRKAVVRPIKLGQQDEEIAVVTDGLRDGEQVITTGFARLTDGKAVTVPGAPPDAGQPPGRRPRPDQERRGTGGQTSGDSPPAGTRRRS